MRNLNTSVDMRAASKRLVKDDTDIASICASSEPATLPPPVHPSKHLDCRMLVAARSPHLVLAVSKGLRQVLQSTAAQLCDRSINVICGPLTNKMSITAAIKNVIADDAGETREIPMLSIYARSGQRHRVRLTCTVHDRSDDGAVLSCCLQFGLEQSDSPLSPGDYKIQSGPANVRRGSLPSTRAEYRARYNFLAGLDLERDRARASRAEIRAE